VLVAAEATAAPSEEALVEDVSSYGISALFDGAELERI
jgi:hypothetical protein